MAPPQVHLTPGAAAAVMYAGMPLFECLLLMLSALLSGDWAGWLRGPNKRLREVPAQADIAADVRAQVQGFTQPGRAGFGPWTWPQQLPLVWPGFLGSATGGARTGDVCQLWPLQPSSLPAQQVAAGGSSVLWQLLLQQQQQHLSAAAGGGLRHQLPCTYQQRVLAALPVPGPAVVQLPNPLMPPASGTLPTDPLLLQSVSSTGAGSKADLSRLGKQQQEQEQSLQAVGQRLDVWVPICATGAADTSRRSAAAAAAAADSEAGGVEQQGGSAAAGDAAAAQLLRGCVRQPKQKLLYLVSGYESD